MTPPPETIIGVIAPFTPLFTQPVWRHVQVLLIGAILCQGSRTVTAVLRVMGLSQDRGFCRYHRVLSRDQWSGRRAAQILLGLLIACLPSSWVPVVAVDDTVERRQGRQIRALGCYRDAVRSTAKQVVTCWGLKWISMMLLVRLPWSSRPWALPFLTVLAPSERANRVAGKRHKTTGDWTRQMVKQVSRWLRRPWVLIGDGAYANLHWAWTCVQQHVVWVSRLRLDAQLYAAPPARQPGQRGRPPQKGKRLAALRTRVAEAQQHGVEVELPWYGGTTRRVRLLTGTALWHTSGVTPLPIRWVLVVNATGDPAPAAFFCTCEACEARHVVMLFVTRWNIEVTFEEVRRHLGVETQRQWSDRAIARTTPALLGLFSLTCLMALRLSTITPLLHPATAWYPKAEATFSDVLAAVRRHLWAHRYFQNSSPPDTPVEIPPRVWETLLDQLAAAA